MASPAEPSLSGPPLAGRVVIDLSAGIPGAYCTRLLADGGAEVYLVEAPGGDPLRRWSASGATIPPGADGALFEYLAGGKRSVVVDPSSAADRARLADLIAGADAVVWAPDTPLSGLPELAPARLRESFPGLTVAAITPFGLDGPWSDRPATEFTLQAWSGGILGLGRGAADRSPVHIGGRVGDYLSGTYAAVATMAAWHGGSGELIDLSMLEAHVLCLTYFPVSFHDLLGRPWRSTRYRSRPGVAHAKDGLVAVGCATAQQWFDLCAMVGHPEWIDESRPVAITESAAAYAHVISAWIAERTVAEVRSLASAFRIPNAPVLNGETLPLDEHLVARGAFEPNPRTGHLQPGKPYRLGSARLAAAGPAPELGEHTGTAAPPRRERVEHAPPAGLPFEGLRVLDMTAFWAGPSCTHVLAMLGAEVLHVESTSRPDGTRFIGGTPMSEDQWWERSPIFAALNTDKQGVTIDLRSDRGRELLRELVATCDVIVENFTPRVLEQVGLTVEDVHAIKSDVILVRMPGFGLDGPYRDNAAFAYVIEDAAGLTWLTGHADTTPDEPYSLGDPNAGLHALSGLLLALEHRRRTGEGTQVEAAMVDAALAISAEQVTEHSAYGAVLNRAGNRGPTAAPQNTYLSADIDEFGRLDTWVAIAVDSDERWLALRAALGDPEWAAAEELATAAGRRERHGVIDAHLVVWCAHHGADEIVETLWAAGVPVARVLQPHHQGDLPPLRHRGFFETVEHPVAGTGRYATLPFRLSALDGRPVHRAPAPLLGEHTRAVLGKLGHGDDELDELEASGIIGSAPRLGR